MARKPLLVFCSFPMACYPTTNFSPWSTAALSVSLLAALAASPVHAAEAAAPALIQYNAQIQPILAENCFSCHGPDSAGRKAKLRLDRAEFATAERGEHAAAIVPGKPDASPLVERIFSTDTEEIMPPPDSHKTLKPEEKALLKRWIAEGATYQEHWSLLAPVRPAVPVAGTTKTTLQDVAPVYLRALMAGLKLKATRGKHANVLLHVQGYLKKQLDADDKAELSESIAQYLRGQVPLIVPITLLNHYFRKHPNDYIRDSWYMRPYPAEMSLQNDI